MIDWTLLNLPDPQFMANIGEPPPAIAPMPDGSIRPYYGQLVSYKYLRDKIHNYNKSSDTHTNQNLDSLWPLFNVEERKFKVTRPKFNLNKPKNYSRKLNAETWQILNAGKPYNNTWSINNSEQPNWPAFPKPANHAVWPTIYSKNNTNDERAQNSVRPKEWSNSKQKNVDTCSMDKSEWSSNATWHNAETAQNLVRPNYECSADSKQKNIETCSTDNSKRPINATWHNAETAQNLVRPNYECSADSKQKNIENCSTDNSKRPINATWHNAETAQNSVRTNEMWSSNSNDTKDSNEKQKNHGYWPLDDSVDDVIMDDGLPQNHALPAAYAMWRDLAKFMSERAFHWKEAEFEFRRERAAIMYEIQLEHMRNGLLEVALEEFHRQEELIEMQRIIRKHTEPTL